MSGDALIDLGRAALVRGEWSEAQSHFEAAVAADETPEALEGLAEACWWQHDEARTFEAREKAYNLYRQAGDRQGAARMATWPARTRWSSGASRQLRTVGWPALAGCSRGLKRRRSTDG
ncbi:MAG TPA: hypothetical protein VGR43_06770 [Dehalococcoidia bacterium]|nr:hypothetical protein [Dehalococcoidia bacterium]